jgi:hypothetical protein
MHSIARDAILIFVTGFIFLGTPLVRRRFIYALAMAGFVFIIAGCSAVTQENYGDAFGFTVLLVAMAAFSVVAMNTKDGVGFLVFLALAIVFGLNGCAALPMPLQPANEQYNSNYAEGAWLVLEGIDTAQTMHIRRGTSCDHEADPIAAKVYGSEYPAPARVLLTNVGFALVHTMVTSWLDDEVASHDIKNDGSVGPWYVGRIVWHGASLLASGASVINNKARGCSL